MEGISPNTTLENSYNLMQDFFTALEDNDSQKLKRIICSKEPVGGLMHKTLLTFKHNLKAVLNGAQSSHSNGCPEGFNRKIKQIERTAFGYSDFINLLTSIIGLFVILSDLCFFISFNNFTIFATILKKINKPNH